MRHKFIQWHNTGWGIIICSVAFSDLVCGVFAAPPAGLNLGVVFVAGSSLAGLPLALSAALGAIPFFLSHPCLVLFFFFLFKKSICVPPIGFPFPGGSLPLITLFFFLYGKFLKRRLAHNMK